MAKDSLIAFVDISDDPETLLTAKHELEECGLDLICKLSDAKEKLTWGVGPLRRFTGAFNTDTRLAENGDVYLRALLRTETLPQSFKTVIASILEDRANFVTSVKEMLRNDVPITAICNLYNIPRQTVLGIHRQMKSYRRTNRMVHKSKKRSTTS